MNTKSKLLLCSAIFLANIYTTSGQTPFKGIAHSIPGIIECEDYDEGGEGKGYHDNVPGNEFNIYRNDDVDIKVVLGDTTDYNISNIQANEWLVYTLNIPRGGTFEFQARVGTVAPNITLHLELDGVKITDSLKLKFTGRWDNYETQTLDTIEIPDGTHQLKVYFEADSFKFTKMYFNAIHLTDPKREASFSPNGDGIADKFFIENRGNIKIYNAQGKLLKLLQGPAYWDGTDYSQALLTTGYYLIVVDEKENIPITIIR